MMDDRVLDIRVDDPRRAAALLREHLAEVSAISPPESTHAMPADRLVDAGAAFWTAWRGGELVGCGALVEIGDGHGEIKAMRTSPAARRSGVASGVLGVILEEARRRGYTRVSLETGSQGGFAAARGLYERFGFVACGAFGGYRADPNSVFLTMELGEGSSMAGIDR